MKKTLLIAGLFLALITAGCTATTKTNTEQEVATGTPTNNSSADSNLSTTSQDTAPLVQPKETPEENKTPEIKVAVDTNVPKTVKKAGFSLSEVAQHNSRESCYVAVNAKVYDATPFIDKHPGGAEKILSLCGTDGSSAFSAQHDGQEKPEAMLQSLEIGPLVN